MLSAPKFALRSLAQSLAREFQSQVCVYMLLAHHHAVQGFPCTPFNYAYVRVINASHHE